MRRASPAASRFVPPPPAKISIPLVMVCIVVVLAPTLAAQPVANLPGDWTWSSIFTAMLALAGAWRLVECRKSIRETPIILPVLLSLVFVALAFLSLLGQWLLISHGHPHYMDAMLKGLSIWVAFSALLATVASLRDNRTALYALAAALIMGAAIAASQGMSDYLLHVKHGEITARESGTSSPDFFAGFLVMSIPVTLALFLGAPSGQGRVLWMLYGMAFLVQAGVLPATGSRFGLISFALSLVVFAAGLIVSHRHGLRFEAATRMRLIALSILVLLLAGLAARPILHRLQGPQVHAQANSADFRVWTWKGAARYALAHPVLGTGPGTFVYGYQQFAYVGFTRHAHNTYLQVADELGVPAMIVLLGVFGITLAGGLRRLAIPNDPERAGDQTNEFLQNGAPTDDRFLVCGLIAAVAAGSVQNLVDSDIYVYFNGTTLWALLGLILAFSPGFRSRLTLPNWTVPLGAALCFCVAVLGVLDGMAAFDAQGGDYLAAASLDPLDPQNQRFLGTKVYPAQGDEAATERALVASANLAPDSAAYTRIGKFDEQTGRLAEAAAAYQTGLRYEPQSITLLLALAQLQANLGHPQGSLAAYQTIAAQENSPYGQVPALGDLPEVRYVFADEALGDDFLAHGDAQQAAAHDLHARQIIENYLAAGGAGNGMREVMTGGHQDLELDAQLRDVYVHVTESLEKIYRSEGQSQNADAVHKDEMSHLAQFSGTVKPANPELPKI